jgi:Protein of unknown function (DUF2934)
MSNLGKTDISKITREEIEKRAYELYLKRGGVNGSDQEDWFAAERELLAEREQPANPQGWSVPLSARPASSRPTSGFESGEERRKIATIDDRSSR